MERQQIGGKRFCGDSVFPNASGEDGPQFHDHLEIIRQCFEGKRMYDQPARYIR